MKATLEYKLPDEQAEFDAAVKSLDMQSALHEIAQQVFRPARKHGYPDDSTRELLEKCGDDGELLVAALEKKFYDILREHSVELY